MVHHSTQVLLSQFQFRTWFLINRAWFLIISNNIIKAILYSRVRLFALDQNPFYAFQFSQWQSARLLILKIDLV